MNAQHLINIRDNRKRRIAKKITELNAVKASEVARAERNNRDPILGDTLTQINRLEVRASELSR